MDGFVEAVEGFQVRGWAFDTTNPSKEVEIRISIGNKEIGRVNANLFRADLKDNNVGNGFHAFIFNCDRKLTPDELNALLVDVAVGPNEWHVLDRLPVLPSTTTKSPSPIVFSGRNSDETQTPIFVLGTTRSGTSAVAQALLKIGYEGNQEGHFFDVLAHWSVSLDRFVDRKSDEFEPGRDTTISRFARDYLHSALDAVFVEAAAAAFSTGRWIDKTPNSDMVNLAPHLKRIWPRARFIFMRRRFLENAQSSARKFPEYDFKRNCKEWSLCMSAWLRVRSELTGCAIEIDQSYLMGNPGAVALSLGEMGGWCEEEVIQFKQALTYDWPERTSNFEASRLSIEQMKWDDERIGHYKSLCVDVMREFHYSEDVNYYDDANQLYGIKVL